MASSWLGEGGRRCPGCIEKSPQELPPTQQPKAMQPSMEMSENPINIEVTPAVRTAQSTDGSHGLCQPHRQGAPRDTQRAHPSINREALSGFWQSAQQPEMRDVSPALTKGKYPDLLLPEISK